MNPISAEHTDPEPPRVFASYSHDSPEHKDLVRDFCTLLVEVGVDVRLDQWDEQHRRDWFLWAQEQIREADFILAIASPAYRRRGDGLATPEEGRGAQVETALLRDRMTRNLAEATRRILPVVLPGRRTAEIPEFLCPYSATHYVVDELTLDGIAELLATFNEVSRHPKAERGRLAGNPYAELHAKLQAEENGSVVTSTTHDNHGIANYGTYHQHGDFVAGDKVVRNKIVNKAARR